MVAVAAVPAVAGAAEDRSLTDQWLPRSDGASWIYEWSNSEYAKRRTRERYTLALREGSSFRLGWTTEGLGNPEGTVRSTGQIDYRQTEAGLVTLDWQSTPPPPQYPILCPSPSNCANSLAGTHYLVIWGNRSPVVQEPLVRGARWSSLGGANNDVSSQSRYLGVERVAVPAFPRGVLAAKIETELAQAGALGDPFGSGIRTVWWARGVGPVKVHFRHTGGQTSIAELTQTGLTPKAPPSDTNYFPLDRGDVQRYRWRNSKHLRTPSRQEIVVRDVVNGTARLDVRNLSGPISVRGSYLLSSRLSGLTALQGQTRSATRARIPGLGPRRLSRSRRRRFRTPLDLLTFGFNPVMTAHPKRGDTWRSSKSSRDYRVYGVTGRTRVIGTKVLRTPVGKVRALGVTSTLKQPGFPFGSGRRTAWFAPGKGLVKLVFRHKDGSTSVIDRLR